MSKRLRGRLKSARFSALGVLAALGSAPDLAAREPTWKGPPACQQSAYVAEQVEALTGRSLASVDEYEFAIEIAERPGPTLELKLVTKPRGSGAERTKER